MKKQILALLLSASAYAQLPATVGSNGVITIESGAYISSDVSNVHNNSGGYCSYQAVYQAYQNAYYHNCQIEQSMAAHNRAMEDIYRRIRGGK